MNEINSVDYQLFSAIVQMKEKTLLKSMYNYLKKYYTIDKIEATADYILCEGEAPIMLVAHMDTVFKSPPKQIYYDQRQHVMWSPQGLGADDRAGVFAIMKIIQRGYRPHICLTTQEEMGGIGAQKLIKKNPKAPFDIKYIIQLDRQGVSDCVFYYCDNASFQEYIENYGFITDYGSFSDISTICPVWKIAGVNLSVGYYDEHTKEEVLHTDALYTTIKKVQKMISDIETAPYFGYIPSLYEHYWNKISKAYGWNYPIEEDGFYENYYPLYSTGPCECSKCKRSFSEDDVFPVKTKNGAKTYYCIDCVSYGVNWCENCGEPFEAKKPNELYCHDCAKAKKQKNQNKNIMQ